MDIQKEREAFELKFPVPAHWIEFDKKRNKYFCPYCADAAANEYQAKWEAWQAAKKCVPEGFILVEREKLAMIFETATNALVYHVAPPKHDALSIIQGIARNTMIEAREQKQWE